MTSTPKRAPRKALDYPLEGLRLLGRYHYLTTKQMVELGFASNVKKTATIMQRNLQAAKPLCGKVNYPPSPVKGRLYSLYYLTKYGAQTVIDELRLDPERVSYPKGRPPRLQDYWHRIAMVDFHMAMDTFISNHGGEIAFWHTYFDKAGANRGTRPKDRLRALSKITHQDFYLIPDGVFLVNAPNNEAQYLFTVEVYNGRDTKRVLTQLGKHAYLLKHGAVATNYGLKLPWRVLCIFEDQAALEAVRKRAATTSELAGYENYFAFSTLERVRQDMAQGWVKVTGERLNIFPKERT